MVANAWYTPPSLSRRALLEDGQSDPRTIVGVVAPNYGLEHVTYLMRLAEYRHVRVQRLPLHRLERRGSFLKMTPLVVGARVPLLHTFNMLPLTGPPFVMSFEMEIPYYLGKPRAWQHKLAYKIMASDRCRGLLAFSDTAAEQARTKYTDLGRQDIAAKITTFRGGVLAAKTDSQRNYSDRTAPLRLLFVGADAIRKGLMPLIGAIEKLRAGGAAIELTVVSSLIKKSYVTGSHEPSVSELHQSLKQPWIHHYPSLPYHEVRALMNQHDLLMLPTLDETLGWVVIEAAMERMGTITTNTFALPELVEDGVSGRLLDISLRTNKRWKGMGLPDRREIFETTYARLEQGLQDTLQDVLADRTLLKRWGEAAHAKLAPIYHPDAAALRLNHIYTRALQRNTVNMEP